MSSSRKNSGFIFFGCVLGTALPFACGANSGPNPASAAAASVPVIEGNPSYVVCSNRDSDLEIRNDGDQRTGTASAYASVVPYQGFSGSSTRESAAGPVGTKWAKVSFPATHSGDPELGWVHADLVLLAANCPDASAHPAEPAPAAPIAPSSDASGPAPLPNRPVVQPAFPDYTNASAAAISKTAPGFDACPGCIFPTTKHPTYSYTDGMTKFGWIRANGQRIHAACDLYGNLGDPVRAIADGQIVLGLWAFYDRVCELQEKLDTGAVVRYGEVLCKSVPGIFFGAKVKKGQILGYVGQTHGSLPMLHFELYQGTGSGLLSDFSKPRGFQRRSDLINPTDYLLKWETNTSEWTR